MNWPNIMICFLMLGCFCIDFDPKIDQLENFQMTDRFTLMVKSVAVFNDLQLIRPCSIPMLEDAFELNISEILQ